MKMNKNSQEPLDKDERQKTWAFKQVPHLFGQMSAPR